MILFMLFFQKQLSRPENNVSEKKHNGQTPLKKTVQVWMWMKSFLCKAQIGRGGERMGSSPGTKIVYKNLSAEQWIQDWEMCVCFFVHTTWNVEELRLFLIMLVFIWYA